MFENLQSAPNLRGDRGPRIHADATDIHSTLLVTTDNRKKSNVETNLKNWFFATNVFLSTCTAYANFYIKFHRLVRGLVGIGKENFRSPEKKRWADGGRQTAVGGEKLVGRSEVKLG